MASGVDSTACAVEVESPTHSVMGTTQAEAVEMQTTRVQGLQQAVKKGEVAPQALEQESTILSSMQVLTRQIPIALIDPYCTSFRLLWASSSL